MGGEGSANEFKNQLDSHGLRPQNEGIILYFYKNHKKINKSIDFIFCHDNIELPKAIRGGLAQLVERLLCTQDVRSSSLLSSIF